MAEWKPIKDFPNYEVSDDGIIRSVSRISRPGKGGGKRRLPQKNMSPQMSRWGYFRVILTNGGSKRTLSVHRIVAESFIPNEQLKPMVNHKDGDKTNNNVANLEWVTPSENNYHAVSFVAVLSGENHYKAKLTSEQVFQIRNDTRIHREIAREYGVCTSTIDHIFSGRNWKGV